VAYVQILLDSKAAEAVVCDSPYRMDRVGEVAYPRPRKEIERSQKSVTHAIQSCALMMRGLFC
jgi:hypothetical protein